MTAGIHRRLIEVLARFRRDARGNTLAIVAAATIPLVAMIGAGIDMARAYTVQARLQQACDAASLAGRRAMLHDSIDADVTAETTKFFNFNYPQGMYGTSTFTPTITRSAPGAVKVVATTTLPTLIMQIVGYRTFTITTDCVASQDFINADVMLVLDVTGSMDKTLPDGKKRIEALRAAVLALYDQLKPTQDFLEQNGYRLRYSFLPYSQTVNVGRLLYAVSPSNLQTSSPYIKQTWYCTGSCSSLDDVYIYSNGTTTASHNTAFFTGTDWGGCIEERQTLVTAGATPTAAEMADSRMKDLNIDLAATTSNPTTQWVPYDPAATGNGAYLAACPAAAVLMKAYSSRNDIQTYVNNLTPTGSTYHDIGMIWGARMLSAGGVFGVSPETYNGMRTNKYMVFLTDGEMEPTYAAYSAYGMEYFDRRIVGGSAASNPVKLSAVAGTDSNQVNRHNGRFLTACSAVRNMPAQLYVIALATSITQPLRDCVNNNNDRVKTAANQAELISQFAQIGQDISELRLSL